MGMGVGLIIEETGAHLLANPDSSNHKYNIMGKKEYATTVADRVAYATKEVLTSAEAAKYMGISMSYLYKLTMRQQIPHYKPMGKMCYFNRHELEEWLQSNRVSTDNELKEWAQAYCLKKGGVR